MPSVSVRAAGAKITVSGDGTAKMSAAIDASKKRAQNLTQPYRDFQPFWWENERTIFQAEGIPRWPELSPGYAAMKAKLYPGKTILRRTDRLYFSLTSSTSDSMYDVTTRNLRMGTTVPYAQKHTTGEGVPVRIHVELLKQYFDVLNGLIFVYISEPFGPPTL